MELLAANLLRSPSFRRKVTSRSAHLKWAAAYIVSVTAPSRTRDGRHVVLIQRKGADYSEGLRAIGS